MAAIFTNSGLLQDLHCVQVHFSNAFAWMILFKNDVTIDEETEFADLVSADFSGFANAGLNNHDSGWDAAEQRAYLNWDTITFEHNGGPESNTVYGWAIVALDPVLNVTVIIMAKNLATPKVMAAETDFVTVESAYYVYRH